MVVGAPVCLPRTTAAAAVERVGAAKGAMETNRCCSVAVVRVCLQSLHILSWCSV